MWWLHDDSLLLPRRETASISNNCCSPAPTSLDFIQFAGCQKVALYKAFWVVWLF